MTKREGTITRRRLLAGAATTGAGLAVGGAVAGPAAAGRERRRRGRVRIVHFTDAHVKPEIARSEPETRRALELALDHLRPDLVLQGGDAIYDALEADATATAAQWDAFTRIYRGIRTPVAHVLGNHDCWTGPGSAGDPRAGKAWAQEAYGLERTYYTLDLRGWKLIVLDSITLTGGSAYVGRLGDAQTAWLTEELARTPASRHVVLATHIPIQTALPFTDASLRDGDDFTVPGGWGVHSDLPEINSLLRRHPNVRLALSGHNHVRDDITYNGVRYACGGAVAGNWWDDADPGYRETPPGVAVVDLHRDGTAEHRYLSYREIGAEETPPDGAL